MCKDLFCGGREMHNYIIETERLIIRSMELTDEQAFIEMASDGSLDEDILCGWDGKYH